MATAETDRSGTEAAILDRLIRPDRADITPQAAEVLLQLRLDRVDLDRLHDLVTRNQDDALTPIERDELESYLRVSAFVDLMHAKARRALATRS